MSLKLHWLPVKYCTAFKIATLVYKFLHSGIPQYFDTYFQLCKCGYNTRCCQNRGKYPRVPRFQPSVHKSAEHFTSSFAFDAAKMENEPWTVHIHCNSYISQAVPMVLTLNCPCILILLLVPLNMPVKYENISTKHTIIKVEAYVVCNDIVTTPLTRCQCGYAGRNLPGCCLPGKWTCM